MYYPNPRRNFLSRFTPVVLAPIFLLGTAPQPSAQKMGDERIVIVIRHGLRAPTETAAELTALAGRRFPDWPVAPGELTPRGEARLGDMARSLSVDLRASGFLDTKCYTHATVWADARDRRTRRSGDIVAAALGPCAGASQYSTSGHADPLFDATRANTCALPKATPQHLPAQERASQIAAAQYLAYAQGLQFQAASGRKGSQLAEVRAAMQSHEKLVARQFGTLSGAGARTAALTQAITTFLDGRETTNSPLIANARVAAIIGHDTDLAGLRAVFGLDWTLPGQPDSTAPATGIMFRRRVDPTSGRQMIRAIVYYQTLRQIRTGLPLRAHRMVLHFNACHAGTACDWSKVRDAAINAVPASCRW